MFPFESKRDVHCLAFPFSHLPFLSSWSLHRLYLFNCFSKLSSSKDFCFHRYLQRQSTSLLYFGLSTYFFFFATVFIKDIRSPSLGNAGHIWTIFEAHLDGTFALTLKHIQRCHVCKSGKICYQILQERNVHTNNFTFTIYLSYLVYAPIYISGPIISFNAFASQLDVPQNYYSVKEVTWYGLRWVFGLSLMELMTHLFYFNAFAVSGSWKMLSPMDIFIIGYGVINFMWLKFFLIWRYFRFWSLIAGIEAPENMPKCVNNCHNLESFWKSWHASFNKWIVRYMYIPLGGSRRKLLNIWVIFTFVAIWHDLEWKLLSWAWLTCLFFVPEMLVKSAANALQAEGALGGFIFHELRAAAGAITITCLMVANLVGYVIGPSGINWLISQFLRKEGLSVLGFMLLSFYVGTKLMFQISDAKQRMQ
ncbi:putative membrane-bound O-acyltransferase C24H6.01c isoform X3 [Herrania umbratica]|uniref:Membrane-bound O-acyltransferase C24H6.01c isoform X3 n=1 Tax=Herrania umbratica TaxID=108875 RepID=A0A6J1A5U1_9ROSI|nr:putative membrane-bound O-acyltransferase C24H6.01c isoform X3 [Herrania umbratica]